MLQARDETYIPGVTRVSPTTLNALQDDDVLLWRALAGGDFSVGDDFLGPSIDSSLWQTPSGTVALLDDRANGGFGAVKLTVSLTAAQLRTIDLPIGTRDF